MGWPSPRLLRMPQFWIASGFGSGLAPVASGTAGSLAALSPLALITQVHYCWLLGLMAALAIVFGCPRVKAPAASD